jgi:predicted helicase
MSIYSILDSIKAKATSERDKGDQFEKLMLAYFRTEPTYKYLFKNVWLWKDWKANDGRPDTGIDLVAENTNGDGFTAIQCKMYSPTTTLDKSDIDSFFTESGKSPFTQRIIVSTTSLWTIHAENSLKGQDKPVIRIGVEALSNSAIDWDACDPQRLDNLKIFPTKKRHEHQKEAIAAVIAGFKNHNRGKLIMACGTGKTFTAQSIAEDSVGMGKTVLVLVPSISLLSQTVKEWTANSNIEINVYAVCSDSKAGRKRDSEDASPYDLALPATTDVNALVKKFKANKSPKRMSVILSTYQSISIVADAQKKGIGDIELIIADEAHRTTGVTLIGNDDSNFTKVHDNNFIVGKKRLYMTATPRMYGEAAKAKAASVDATVSSMDDETVYGPEFYRLEFYEAVQRDLLTDYKVIVLAVNEDAVAEAFQRQLADKNHELKLDEATRIIGCLNAFSKIDPSERYFQNDKSPMKRVVAFSNTIVNSIKFKEMFNEVSSRFNAYTGSNAALKVTVDHVDGSFNSLKREELLGWLKNEPADSFCSVLSNAKCLTEGVDVPTLDGIVFLEPRNSIVDVVQAVGRVMRKSLNKKYGYVILPIGIPSGVTPEEALSDNKRYAAVWQVLNALRSHDKRIEAVVKKIDLNDETPEMIEVIPVGFSETENSVDANTEEENEKPKALQLEFPLEEIRAAIYAKMVEKVGTRQYWENWAKDVAQIAERHVEQISKFLNKPNSKFSKEFSNFLTGIRSNLNESITKEDAIEMLAQHLITKPVFDAVFGDSEFTERNPVSRVMQNMVTILEEKIVDTDKKTLESFYLDVAKRVEGIDNLQGKQKVITELYEKFFRIAFKRTSDKLGVVYTPIEIVDFVIHSVESALKDEFASSMGKKNVEILDPFTGTGTFIARLLQSGIIPKQNLKHKYENELNANELILLAYYIAAINIESVYHEIVHENYSPFEGIVLTDTFQMFEDDDKMDELVFPQNNQRVLKQKKSPIRVVIGNPPYSVGQESMNDNNSNVKYPTLDGRIAATYVAGSDTQLLRSLYDSYIRAIRWATDRIGETGVVGFVTNGSFIDNKAMDGFRKSLVNEFSTIYVFNLRGNARTSGELRKKERGNVFGEGSRTSVAITILIKNPKNLGKTNVFYSDIGDYLTQDDKLAKIEKLKSIDGITWDRVSIDEYGDWINQRDESFMTFDAIGAKRAPSGKEIFELYSTGVKTNRDVWAYNFSKQLLEDSVTRIISNYNQIVKSLQDADKLRGSLGASDLLDFVEKNSDPAKISWDRSLIKILSKRQNLEFDPTSIRFCLYRPYSKKFLYFNKDLNNDQNQIPRIFPEEASTNLVMSINYNPLKPFGLIMTDLIPDVQLSGNGQCFPLYYYNNKNTDSVPSLFEQSVNSPDRKSSISVGTLMKYQKAYGKDVSVEDIFFYVYGLLHSKKYRHRFRTELGKSLPRIPMAKDFWVFSKAGKELSDLHVGYETAPIAGLQGISEASKKIKSIQRLRYDRSSGDLDRRRLIVNDSLVVSDIPADVQEYDISGRSALDWLVDRFEIKKDSDSNILQDPNTWSHDPNYGISLIGRIAHVSIETVKIINSLPDFE